MPGLRGLCFNWAILNSLAIPWKNGTFSATKTDDNRAGYQN
jgi:hypothetical protein